MDWVKRYEGLFKEVAGEYGVRMHHDTHYDALNYEFSKVVGSDIYRLDFQPTVRKSFVVTRYTDSFPVFPRALRFLHNVIPLFPYLAKTNEERLEELDANNDVSRLKEEVVRLVRNAL